MKSIAITGDLGSGKSTVAKILAQKINYEYISTGLIQRKMAEDLGMNTLELNYYSEHNHEIDDAIDNYLKSIDGNEKKYVLDSRLAWHFVKQTFKVYLTVNPEVAALRVMADTQRTNEPTAQDMEERIQILLERQNVENRRYQKLYGVDCRDIKNYDYVLDTSNYSIKEVVDLIIKQALESK